MARERDMYTRVQCQSALLNCPQWSRDILPFPVGQLLINLELFPFLVTSNTQQKKKKNNHQNIHIYTCVCVCVCVCCVCVCVNCFIISSNTFFYTNISTILKYWIITLSYFLLDNKRCCLHILRIPSSINIIIIPEYFLHGYEIILNKLTETL